MSNLFNSLKKISTADLKSVLLLCIAFIPGKVLGFTRKIWLLVDRPDSADDNSWIFYKWIRSLHPEKNAYFILKRECYNFDNQDSHLIAWGTLRHYVYYIASNVFIDSTFTTPRPNIRVCYYFERLFKRHVKKIYLRHGIHKDGVEMHTFAEHRFSLFFCGAKPEYDFFCASADYPKGVLCYTGLARFDDLLKHSIPGRFILVMPTWRRYIGCDQDKSYQENEAEFIHSSFYEHYRSLLINERLISFLQQNGLILRFCLHNLYRKFTHLFVPGANCIQIMTENDSIHNLLTEMGMLVTDYSSVFFDAAYTGKPVVYYQFDYDEFRAHHFSKGYFDYYDDGFGPVITDEDALVNSIINYYDGTSFVRDSIYESRCERFFPLHDTNNCARIYREICRLDETI